MSGSGKPGTTFRALVTKSKNGVATISGEVEDVAYLVPGTEYVFNVMPADSGSSGSSNEPASDPNT